MSAEYAAREGRRSAYLDATAATEQHTSTCSTCTGGCVCGDADALYDSEWRREQELRAVDQQALRAYDRATWPTKG